MTESGPAEQPTTDEGYSPATADRPVAEGEPPVLPDPAPEPVYAIDPPPEPQGPVGEPTPADSLGYSGIYTPGDFRRVNQ